MAVDMLAAAGSWTGPGYVYVLKDRYDRETIYKIGQTGNVDKRLKEIQKQKGHEQAELLDYYEAKEANGAETAAHNAVKEKLKMKKCSAYGGATDWFLKGRVKEEDVLKVVKAAVERHNRGL